jgi:hypothetical protein
MCGQQRVWRFAGFVPLDESLTTMGTFVESVYITAPISCATRGRTGEAIERRTSCDLTFHSLTRVYLR